MGQLGGHRRNVVDEIADLKVRPVKNLLITGSGTLARSLMQYGLLDEYPLMIFPVVQGNGRCLFDDGPTNTALILIDSRVLGSGVVNLTYQPADTPAG